MRTEGEQVTLNQFSATGSNTNPAFRELSRQDSLFARLPKATGTGAFLSVNGRTKTQ